MNKTVVIHQPDFIPYLGFFHRFLHSDLWVIFDNVQYLRRGFHHRDKIKTSSGEKWLTLSTKKNEYKALINEIMLSETQWKEDHLNILKESYRKAPFFKEIFPHIEELYSFQTDNMAEFNIKSISILMDLFDLKIETILASTLDPVGKSNELLVDILKKVDADKYLSGVGARDYYKPEVFENANIEVIWQEFDHPTYNQINGDFIPYLSSIDLLFNCGIEESRKILRSC